VTTSYPPVRVVLIIYGIYNLPVKFVTLRKEIYPLISVLSFLPGFPPYLNATVRIIENKNKNGVVH